jgi:hypothetical protein
MAVRAALSSSRRRAAVSRATSGTRLGSDRTVIRAPAGGEAPSEVGARQIMLCCVAADVVVAPRSKGVRPEALLSTAEHQAGRRLEQARRQRIQLKALARPRVSNG